MHYYKHADMLVSGRNVQNSPLVRLISEALVSHQFFHYCPGSQKYQTLTISHAYFPLPATFMPLKAKGNSILIPGHGTEDVSCFQVHPESTEHSDFYKNA